MRTNFVPFVQIKWDSEHLSPPVGPFENITEAENFAKKLRKLSLEHHQRQLEIRVGFLQSPGMAEAWVTNA